MYKFDKKEKSNMTQEESNVSFVFIIYFWT